MTHPTNHLQQPRATSRAGARTVKGLRKAGLLAGAAVMLLTTSVMAGPATATPPSARTWSGWLQRHVAIEYPRDARRDAGRDLGPGTPLWAQHLLLEYGS